MQFVANWRLPQGQLVHLARQPLEVFNRYLQDGPNSNEAGGILLGHVRCDHLEIIEASEPSVWDRRYRYLFERQPFWHLRLAKKRWKESGGLIRYVGEWHTHPQDHPKPSSIDLHEWQVLAAGREDGRPLLALIVGCQDLHLEYMHFDGQRRLLRHAEYADLGYYQSVWPLL